MRIHASKQIARQRRRPLFYIMFRQSVMCLFNLGWHTLDWPVLNLGFNIVVATGLERDCLAHRRFQRMRMPPQWYKGL